MLSSTAIPALTAAGLLAILAPRVFAASEELDASARRAVVNSVGELLESRYVFPETAEECRRHLEARLDAGDFDALAEPQAFAQSLTEELQKISKDKHLVVHFEPPVEAGSKPEDPDASELRRLADMRSRNYGFERVERLEGNVGYIDMRSFAPPNLGSDTAVAAMAFVANCDALIFDMRQNGGGSPGMVQFVCSHLFDERIHLNSLYYREGDRTVEFWTLEGVPGKQMPDVPVFVLTSGDTFSGAEEFTYNLRTRERATIIGETTRGGANPGMYVNIDEHFGMFVPTGRAINPVTGTNWEGVGVEPHIAVNADDALERALVEARPAAQAFGEARLQARIALTQQVADRVREAREHFKDGRANAGAELLENALSEGYVAGVLDEFKINQLGYECLQSESTEAAIEIFRFNTASFPRSFNTWDSLAEAHAQAGETELAIENYRKSVELNPDNEHAVRMIEQLQKD